MSPLADGAPRGYGQRGTGRLCPPRYPRGCPAPRPLPSGQSLPSRRPGRAQVRVGFGTSVCPSPLEAVCADRGAGPTPAWEGWTRGPDPAPRSARGAEHGRSRSHRLGLCPGGTRLRFSFLLKGIN